MSVFAQSRLGMLFVRKLTLRKVVNYALLVASYWISRVTKRLTHFGMPFMMNIEPTTACNLRCPECPIGMDKLGRAKGRMKFELYQKIIDQSAPTLAYLNLYFQGEPFINPELCKMIEYAHNKNIYICVSSNGHFLDANTVDMIVASGLDRLIISLDGVSQESYEKYRVGGEWIQVIEGVKRLVKAKQNRKAAKPIIELQCLVFRYNENEIAAMQTLSDTLGADLLTVKTAQIYDFEKKIELIPKNRKFTRYINEEGKIRIKGKNPKACWRLWRGLAITWNGIVVPCCFDKKAEHSLGDLNRADLKAIWKKSEIYNSFRRKTLLNRKNIDICANCTER